MARRPRHDPKVDGLRAQGALNRRADRVTDPLFRRHPFFDARDLVQVKYEMLRRVEVDEEPVASTVAAFSFSRPSFYQLQQAVRREGVTGLLPKTRGPHGGHKLTPEVITFLQQARAQDAALRARDLAQQVQARFGITVHPRSIERALARQEEKRRRSPRTR